MPARHACCFLPVSFFRLVVFTSLLGSLLFWPVLVNAQAQTHGVPFARVSSTESFRQIVHKAGLIFDGTVTGVVRERGIGGAPLAYRISFQVKQGMRGVRSGSTVTIREWAGLWTEGDTHEPRYRVGERSVIFFYPPRKEGLTSPVGSGGKLAVDRAGMVALPTNWISHSLPEQPNGASSIAMQSHRIPVRVLAEQVRLAEAN